MASVRSLTKKPKKKTVSKGPRRGAKGLLAPSFDNWEKLDGANFHRLKINVSDFWYQNFKHNIILWEEK